MWSLPRITRDIVSIVITPEQLICAQLKRSLLPPVRYALRAYSITPIQNYAWRDGRIYNYQYLINAIYTFLNTHKLLDAGIGIAIDFPLDALVESNEGQALLAQYKLLAIMGNINLLYLAPIQNIKAELTHKITTPIKELMITQPNKTISDEQLQTILGLYLLTKDVYERN